MNEQYYDALLNIKTVGNQKGFLTSVHYHRYEPTPYRALETLFETYEVKSGDRVVDFGCGKGRLNFYIHYVYQTTVVGIEMNQAFYQEAVENRNRYLKKAKNKTNPIYFQCCLAEEYQIDPADNRFYFFNPFTVQIFIKVINNILLSAEQTKREIELILYYPSEDYTHYLDDHTSFELKEEVLLQDYTHNPYEKFSIYRLAY